jgi:hypothetical protein
VEVKEMLKKIALPVVALVVMLILASAPAKAAVRFGVTVGPPVYTYPAYPYDPYAYANPYADPYAYPGYYDNYYYAPAPAYAYPYFSYGYRGGFGHGGHELQEHRVPAFRGGGHEQRGGFGGSGGHRR